MSDSHNATVALKSHDVKSFLYKLTNTNVSSTTTKISHHNIPDSVNKPSSIKPCDIIDLADDSETDEGKYPNLSKTLFATSGSSATQPSLVAPTLPSFNNNPLHYIPQPLSSSTSSSSSSNNQQHTLTLSSSNTNNNSKSKTNSKVLKVAKSVAKVTAVKKVPAKNLPHALLWICHHGLGQKKSWTGNTLKVLGVYANKEAAEQKKQDIMSRHECYGHGDICVGGTWEDEIDLVIKPIDDVAI